MVGGQNPGPEAPSRNQKGQERREQRRCQGRSDCWRSGEKGKYVRIIEGEEDMNINQSNTSHGGRKYLLSPRGVMAIEVPQNEKISLGGKNGGRKGVGSAIQWRRANREAYTSKK